jgi:hypothetical protein
MVIMKKLIVLSSAGLRIPNSGLRQQGEGWLVPSEVSEEVAQQYATNLPQAFKLVEVPDEPPTKGAKKVND